MVFTADDKGDYVCGPYKICWAVPGWSVWNLDRRKACLGRDLTISEAMSVAEKDSQTQTGAVRG